MLSITPQQGGMKQSAVEQRIIHQPSHSIPALRLQACLLSTVIWESQLNPQGPVLGTTAGKHSVLATTVGQHCTSPYDPNALRCEHSQWKCIANIRSKNVWKQGCTSVASLATTNLANVAWCSRGSDTRILLLHFTCVLPKSRRGGSGCKCKPKQRQTRHPQGSQR